MDQEQKAPHNFEWALGFILISFLIIIFLLSFNLLRARARDMKRRADVSVLVKALDLYYDRYGRYPDSVDDWQGWDLSYKEKGGGVGFLAILKNKGDLVREVFDPINTSTHHYRYKRFVAGEFGCTRSYYILQVDNFELAAKDIGSGSCADFNWTNYAPNGFTVQTFE